MRAFLLLVMTMWVLCTTPFQPVQAQETAEDTSALLEQPLEKGDAEALIARLSDQDVRQILLEQLRLKAEAEASQETESERFFEILDAESAVFFSNFIQTFTRVPLIPGDLAVALGNFFGPKSWGEIGKLVLVLILSLAAGYAAQLGLDRFSANQHRRVREATPEGLGQALKTLSLRLVLLWLDIIVSAIASFIVIAVFYARGSDDRITLLMIIAVIVITRFFHALARFLFAPKRPDLRICVMDDASAAYLTRQVSIIACYAAATSFLIGWLFSMGMEPGSGRLSYWLAMILQLMIINVLWQGRHAITSMVIGNEEDATPGIRKFARSWPKIAIGLVIFQWLIIEVLANTGRVELISRTAVYTTLFLVIFLPVFDTMVRAVVGHTFQGEDVTNPEARRSLHAALIRCGRVVLGVFAVLLLTSLWGIDLETVAEGGFGARFAGKIVEAFLIVLIAYAIWEFINILIIRQTAREQPASADDAEGAGDMGGKGGTRLATILPLVRACAQIAIIILTVLVVLGEMGVNIAPLLAGAGILGLAIGFGAQTLVKDIVSGFFFLLDDALRIGEYVDVGGTMGTVEKLSVRSLRLRHHRGAVHTVPYGEIQKLTNFSRDWVIVKLKWRVPFETDVNQVKRIFKQIGKDLLQDPELGPDFLAPFKSQGVADVDDIGITVRGKFTASPGKQFMIQREIYVRVQKAFEAAGIEFARRQVTVRMPDSEHLEGDQAKQIEHAALAAVNSENEEEPEKR